MSKQSRKAYATSTSLKALSRHTERYKIKATLCVDDCEILFGPGSSALVMVKPPSTLSANYREHRLMSAGYPQSTHTYTLAPKPQMSLGTRVCSCPDGG